MITFPFASRRSEVVSVEDVLRVNVIRSGYGSGSFLHEVARVSADAIISRADKVLLNFILSSVLFFKAIIILIISFFRSLVYRKRQFY